MANNYKTRDLGLAAAMVTLGKKVTELNPISNRGAYTFSIDVPFQEGKGIESEYYNGMLIVPAFKLMQEVRNLKARISEEQTRGGRSDD